MELASEVSIGAPIISASVALELIDPRQVDGAESFAARGGWVSHLVLAETIWVLDAVYERTPEQLATAIDMLLNHEQLTIQDAEVVGNALEHFKKRPTLGFTDCLVLEIARKSGHLPLGAFDRDLGKLDGTERLQ